MFYHSFIQMQNEYRILNLAENCSFDTKEATQVI